jgi:hypothetical protein
MKRFIIFSAVALWVMATQAQQVDSVVLFKNITWDLYPVKVVTAKRTYELHIVAKVDGAHTIRTSDAASAIVSFKENRNLRFIGQVKEVRKPLTPADIEAGVSEIIEFVQVVKVVKKPQLNPFQSYEGAMGTVQFKLTFVEGDSPLTEKQTLGFSAAIAKIE